MLWAEVTEIVVTGATEEIEVIEEIEETDVTEETDATEVTEATEETDENGVATGEIDEKGVKEEREALNRTGRMTEIGIVIVAKAQISKVIAGPNSPVFL